MESEGCGVYEKKVHEKGYITIHVVDETSQEENDKLVYSIKVPEIKSSCLESYGVNIYSSSLLAFFIFDVCTFEKTINLQESAEKTNFLKKMFTNMFIKSNGTCATSIMLIKDVLGKMLGRLERIDTSKIFPGRSPTNCKVLPRDDLLEAMINIYNIIVLEFDIDKNKKENILKKIFQAIQLKLQKLKLQKLGNQEFPNIKNIGKNMARVVAKHLKSSCSNIQSELIPGSVSLIPYVGTFISQIKFLCKPESISLSDDDFIKRINVFLKVILNHVVGMSTSFTIATAISLAEERLISKQIVLTNHEKSVFGLLTYEWPSLNEKTKITSINPDIIYESNWWYLLNKKYEFKPPYADEGFVKKHIFAFNAELENQINNLDQIKNLDQINKLDLKNIEIKLNLKNVGKEVTFGPGPVINQQSGGARKKYKGHSYVVREGKRGGHYINVKGKKVYI